MLERTLVVVKPDAVQRGLVGELISRFERRGLKLVAMKMMHIDEALAHRHYADHKGKPFYEGLIRYITSAPVVVAVLEGPRAIEAVRTMIGVTDPLEAVQGTIRADLALVMERNLVHASDGPQTAIREMALFFDESELLSWSHDLEPWLLV